MAFTEFKILFTLNETKGNIFLQYESAKLYSYFLKENCLFIVCKIFAAMDLIPWLFKTLFFPVETRRRTTSYRR